MESNLIKDFYNKLTHKKSFFSLPPHLPNEAYQSFMENYYKSEDHFYLCSSGTSSKQIKIFEYKKDSIFGHAKAVSNHFSINHSSRLLISLPSFFMGGFSIYTRGLVSGAKIFSSDHFSIKSLMDKVNLHQITHVSLVPTQVYDLIYQNIAIPKSLKMIFIGGDKISLELFNSLHFKISNGARNIYYPTYGSTELCSQIATSKFEKYNSFKILPWNDIQTKQNSTSGQLVINSPYHFSSAFSILDSLPSQSEKALQFIESPYSEPFKPEDIGKVSNGYLSIVGRKDRLIKSKGLFIDLNLIEEEVKRENPTIQLFSSYIKDSRRVSIPVILYLGRISPKNTKVKTIRIDKFKYTDSMKLIKRADAYL